MPAWLSPRVRLGATVLLIVLIACAIVLTPYLFHDEADAPDSLTSASATVDLSASSSPSLPRRATSHPFIPVAYPHSNELSLPTNSDTYASDSDSESDPSAETTAEPVIDWLGQNPLAGQGIAWPLSDCLDCGPTPRQPRQFTHLLFFEITPGGAPGGGGGGGAAGPTELPPVTVTDFEPPTTAGDGPGDGTSTPPGPENGPPDGRTGPDQPNGPKGPGDPGDPIGPDPHEPPVVQVPEPASFVMAGAGALSFMIRAHLSRKRQR